MSIQSLIIPLQKKVLDYLNDDEKYKLFIASGKGMFLRCYGIGTVEKLFYEARINVKIYKKIKSDSLISKLIFNGYNLKADLENVRTTFLNQLHAMADSRVNSFSAYLRDIRCLLDTAIFLNINVLLILALMMHPENGIDAKIKAGSCEFAVIVDILFLLKAIDRCREKSNFSYCKSVVQKITQLQYELNKYTNPANQNTRIEEQKTIYEMV